MSNIFDVDIKGFKQTLQGDAARLFAVLLHSQCALHTEATRTSGSKSAATGASP